MTEVFVLTKGYYCPSDSCTMMPDLDGGVTVLAVFATFECAADSIKNSFNKMSGSVTLIKESTNDSGLIQWDYKTPHGDLLRLSHMIVADCYKIGWKYVG